MDDHGTGSAPPRRPEPSWPTVIATTVRLWVERHPSARRRARRSVTAVIAVAAVAAVAVVATDVVVHIRSSSHPAAEASAPSADSRSTRLLLATAARDQAAAWIEGQVAADAIVACDPAMCAALQARGLPASRLVVLTTSSADPLGSDVVVATQAVRTQFGARLASVYAPVVIASFGSGAGRIDIRAVAPYGAAAYVASFAADEQARIAWGRQLAGNKRISFSAGARAALEAGKVDPRLLLTLDALAGAQQVSVVSFGDPSPGAGAAIPFRSAEISPAGPGSGSGASLQSMLSFLDAQRPPYLPAQAGIAGKSVLNVEYAAPSPLGLLSGP
jgi:hypothetical protein